MGNITDQLGNTGKVIEFDLTVTDKEGDVQDTIIIDNHPSPVMSLNIPDTNICLLDTIVLDGGEWYEYQWNYNNSTNQTVNVFAAGYHVARRARRNSP